MTSSDFTKWRNSRAVTEIAPKLPFLFVNRIPIQSGMVFVSANRVIRYSVDTESVAEPSCFLSRYVVYFDYMLEFMLVENSEFCTGVRKTKTKDQRPKTRKTKTPTNWPSYY